MTALLQLHRLRRAAVAGVFVVGVVGSVASEPNDGSVTDEPFAVDAAPVTLRFGLDAGRAAYRFAVVVDDSDVDGGEFTSVSADVSVFADLDSDGAVVVAGFDAPDGSGDVVGEQGSGSTVSYFRDSAASDLIVRRTDGGAGVVTVDVVVTGSVLSFEQQPRGEVRCSVEPDPS